MTRRVLLDANLIISAFDNQQADAKKKIAELLSDEQVAIAISPLIRYEVLRGVAFSDHDKYSKLNEILNHFEEFDIDNKTADLSAQLFRFARSTVTAAQNRVVDKRSFDVFHLTTAKCNDLELCSNDGDLSKLERLYNDWNTKNPAE